MRQTRTKERCGLCEGEFRDTDEGLLLQSLAAERKFLSHQLFGSKESYESVRQTKFTKGSFRRQPVQVAESKVLSFKDRDRSLTKSCRK